MAHPKPALTHQGLLDLWRGRLLEALKNYNSGAVKLQNTRPVRGRR